MSGITPRTKYLPITLAALLMMGAVGTAIREISDGTKSVHWDTELSGQPLLVARLEDSFQKLGYDFEQVKLSKGPVPRVFVPTVPEDLAQVAEVDRRKALFLGSVLPVVLAVNEQLAVEHSTVENLAKKIRLQDPLSFFEAAELERLAKEYEIISEDDTDDSTDLSDIAVVDELLFRVAPIPVSMALAQAAEESAWGLSRFAAEGNALYGQWVWNDDEGIVPTRRKAGQGHSVQAFGNIFESTQSYAHNLNTHRAYERFRKMRANMLNATGRMDGNALAATLTRYSGRGQAYVESLRSIMRANELSSLDRAQLTERDAPALKTSPLSS